MKIVAIVGSAETGKTNLIISLLERFHQQGLTCAVLKMAQEEIELDQRGKDSWRFEQAGATKIGVLTGEKFFLIKRREEKESWSRLIKDYFLDVDFLLIEGGKKEPELKKVLVARGPADLKMVEPPESLLAVISAEKFESPLPHFYPHQIEELASFLHHEIKPIEPLVYLKINGVNLPLNPFVEAMLAELIQAMIKPLKGVPDSPRLISITLIK